MVPNQKGLVDSDEHDSEHCSVEARDQVCHNQFEEATKKAPILSVNQSLK